MKRELRWTLGSALLLCGTAFAQADRRTVDPWLEESDQLPAPEHRMELIASLEQHHQINRFDPLIVRLAFTNQDSNPLTVETRRDGAPYILASLVARGDGPFERHDQWLMRNSPEYRDKDLRITLQKGESTSGEFLILFGGPPTGLPFADAGRYRVRIACQPDRHFAPTYSNELIVTVVPGTGANDAFLRDLDALTFEYHGYDREAMLRNVGRGYHVGVDLLRHIIRQDRPHFVAPDENPQDRKEAELVTSLAELLERHPNSAYSGYIARFLGLVYVKTFEHELSVAEAKAWRETGNHPVRTTESMIVQPAYQNALRYLSMAQQADLWPRTTAALHLGRLYLMSEQWEKADAIASELRAKYVRSNGAAAGEELVRDLTAYRADLAEKRSGRGGK